MRIQYQALAEPPQGLPGVPVLSWAPVCPDQTPRTLPRAAALLLVACVLVPQHEAAEGSALDWTPRYPDAIHRLTVHPSRTPFSDQASSPQTLPPIFAASQIDWLPSYPDWIARRTIAACQIPFTARRPNPVALPPPADVPWFPLYPDTIDAPRQPAWQLPQHIAPAPVMVTLPKKALLEWLPRFPDQIRRPGLRTAAQLAYSGPPLASYDFTWLPRYPDTIRRARVLTALQTAFVTGEIRPKAPPLQIWDPIYPGQIPRRRVHASQQQALAYALGPTLPPAYPPPHTGDLDKGNKLAKQLSQFAVTQRRPYLLTPISFDPVPIPNPPPAEGYPDGYVVFPDQLLPMRRLATEAQLPFAFYVIPLLPDPQLAWQPAMPDQYRFRTPLPIDQREVMVGPLNDVTVLQPVVWLPTFPDRFAARVSATSAPVIVEVGQIVEIAVLGWGVEAPAWIARPSGWREAGAVLVIQPPATGAEALEVLIGNERVEASTLTATTLVGD